MHCGRAIALLLLLTAPLLPAQLAERTTAKGSFPALQLLPPGSKIRGISLPRYREHRVISHIMADMLEVLTNRVTCMENVHAMLYGVGDDTTEVRIERAQYDFGTEVMTSGSPVTVENPRYSVKGSAIILHMREQRGLLRGPVSTALQPDALQTTPRQ